MKTLYRRNETSVPAVSTPASTRRPPCHSTTATPLNNANVITPTNTPRTSARRNAARTTSAILRPRSEEHTSELQSLAYLVCRLLLEKKKQFHATIDHVSSTKKTIA